MKNEKIEIILQLEYSSGAILFSDINTGESFTESNVINEDPILCDLNAKIGKLYSSYFTFNNDNAPCSFNEEMFEKDKLKLKSLVEELRKRIEDLNEGNILLVDNISLELE